MKNLHEMLKEMLNNANVEVLRETGKLKIEVEKNQDKVITESKNPQKIEETKDNDEHGPDEDEDKLDRQARKEKIKAIKMKAKERAAKKVVSETNIDDPAVTVDTTAISQVDDTDQKLAKSNWKKSFAKPRNKIKDDAENQALVAGKPIRENEEIDEATLGGEKYKGKSNPNNSKSRNPGVVALLSGKRKKLIDRADKAQDSALRDGVRVHKNGQANTKKGKFKLKRSLQQLRASERVNPRLDSKL